MFTIKKVDKQNKKIIYSFDFAIVNYYSDDIKNSDFDDEYDELDNEYFSIERQEIILFNITWISKIIKFRKDD